MVRLYLVRRNSRIQVNSETQTAENLYYKDLDPAQTAPSRRNQNQGQDFSSSADPASRNDIVPAHKGIAGSEHGGEVRTQSNTDSEIDNSPRHDKGKGEKTGQPRFLFATAEELHRICHEQNMTIAQVVWENELAFRSEAEIREGLMAREWSLLQYS